MLQLGYSLALERRVVAVTPSRCWHDDVLLSAPALPPQVSLPTQYNGQKQDPVGALSGALARLQANRGLRELREIAKGITKQLPEGFQEVRQRRYTARNEHENEAAVAQCGKHVPCGIHSAGRTLRSQPKMQTCITALMFNPAALQRLNYARQLAAGDVEDR